MDALLIDRATTGDNGPDRQVAVTTLAQGWPDEQTRALLTDRATTDAARGLPGALV